MDLLGAEFLKLISTFEINNLKYIVVGGFATYYHGFQRTTGDIDFWIRDDQENRLRLVECLDQMQYGRMEELLRIPFLAGYCEVMLDNGVYADFMNSILGFEEEEFDDCFERAVIANVEGVPVRFIHLNDLIHSKETSHRPKDLLDALELKRIHSKD